MMLFLMDAKMYKFFMVLHGYIGLISIWNSQIFFFFVNFYKFGEDFSFFSCFYFIHFYYILVYDWKKEKRKKIVSLF